MGPLLYRSTHFAAYVSREYHAELAKSLSSKFWQVRIRPKPTKTRSSPFWPSKHVFPMGGFDPRVRGDAATASTSTDINHLHRSLREATGCDTFHSQVKYQTALKVLELTCLFASEGTKMRLYSHIISF